MAKITIKKISSEVVYNNRADRHIFEVNGKRVRVGTWHSEDYEVGSEELDGGEDINQEDLKALTDEEHEAFGEDLMEWLDMKDGEEETIEICKGCNEPIVYGQNRTEGESRHATCS